VRLQRLWLADFRSYASAELVPAPGLTAVVGANGQGKSNLLEAVAWLATLSSFRGAPSDALVRVGAGEAVVRAEVEGDDPGRRTVLLEAVLRAEGRDQVLVNRQRLRRVRDLLGSVRVTVFSPDDLALVKGGPAERRRLLDDALVTLAVKHDALRGDLERVLRQRGTLLRQSGGRATPEVVATLDVWDAKLAELGEATGRARAALVARLQPLAAQAYDDVAAASASVTLGYDPPWRRVEGGLAAALAAARAEDLRRGTSTVGPHRDELELSVNGLPARTHASQGEQRSLALALRLATHGVVTDVTGSSPILLLDDVFSELDPDRSHALLAHLPPGQALLTTAGAIPEGAEPDLVVQVAGGRLRTGGPTSEPGIGAA
jgi:DNA replication and repair protein RecF